MITSGCERMGCILRAVIECNLMVGRSKPKGSSIPELWSQIDKLQLPDFDHPHYQFTWWRAFPQYKLDGDVFLGGRSTVHWKGSGRGDVNSRTKLGGFQVQTCVADCWAGVTLSECWVTQDSAEETRQTE